MGKIAFKLPKRKALLTPDIGWWNANKATSAVRIRVKMAPLSPEILKIINSTINNKIGEHARKILIKCNF